MLVFPVTSYPWKAFLAIVCLVTVLPLVVVGIVLFFAQAIPGWLLIFVLSVAIGFMLSITVGLTALLVYVTTRNEVTLRSGVLHIKGGSYHQRVTLDRITKIRIVDLGSDKAFAPSVRENGIRLPGYQVGWYTLNNGTRAFVLRTTRNRAVYVETSADFSVLLGVKDPEALFRQLNLADAGGCAGEGDVSLAMQAGMPK